MGTEERWAQRNGRHRGTVGTEEQWAQRNSGHRGTVGTEEQRAQRGTEGTEQWAQRNRGHREEQRAQRNSGHESVGGIRAKHSASSLKVFICNFCLSSNASLSWLGTSFFPRVRHLWIRCMAKPVLVPVLYAEFGNNNIDTVLQPH